MLRLRRRLRRHPLRIAALLLAIVLLLVAGLIWLRRARRAPSDLQVQNIRAVAAMEERLDRVEAQANLQALWADIQAGRPGEELERRLARIRDDLEAAYRGAGREERQGLQSALDELGLELRDGAAVQANLEALFELLEPSAEGTENGAR